LLYLATASLFLTKEAFVSAQTPSYQGALLIEPVLDNAKCIKSQNGNVNGSPLVIADCDGSVDQQFTFSGGSLTAYSGAMCVDVTNGNATNGVKLQLWQCFSGSANQQWYWTGDNQ
jgi:hypothetical protein